MSRNLRGAALLAVTAAALAVAGVGASTVGAQEAATEVRIVHDFVHTKGVGQAPLTFCFDGEAVAQGITSGDEAGPFEVDAGTPVDVRVLAGSTDDCTEPSLLDESWTPEEGTTSTLVAHNDADGVFTVSWFADDPAACLAEGTGRLAVIHGSALWPIGMNPDLDVVVGGETTHEDLTNGEIATVDVDAGTHALELWAVGTDELLIEETVTVGAGEVVEVYVNGGDAGPPPGTFTLVRAGTVCDTPVTTSTTAATTSTTATPDPVATAATPVRATPSYTG